MTNIIVIDSDPEISSIKDLVLKDLIMKILDKNLEKRLKGPEAIKAHPWF